MPPIDPQPSAQSLGDFSAKPRSADLSAPVPFHDFEPKQFARRQGAFWPDDFVELLNPTSQVLSAILFLGPIPGSQPFRGRPEDADDDDGEPNAKHRAAAWAHQCTLFTRIVFAPGATQSVPRSLVSALVTVKDGQVIGGHIPQLVLPGDPHPPTMHPSLIPEGNDAQPFSVPSGKPRGNAKTGAP